MRLLEETRDLLPTGTQRTGEATGVPAGAARLVIAVPGFANSVTMPARMQEVRRDAIMALEKNRGAVV